MKHPLTLIALFLAVTTPVTGQQKLALTRPDAEFGEPYTSLRSIRELSDGRVLVADPIDKVVHLLDFKTGTVIKVGREGQGPEEYMVPMSLFSMPDGGALLQDLGNRRFLTIGANGKIGKAVTPPTPPAPSGTSGERRMMFGGFFNAQASDAKGNLYAQGMAMPDADGKAADSMPVSRWSPGTDRIDTLAWLPVTEGMRPTIQRDAGRSTMMVRLGTGAAWPRQVAWAVASDGRIAVVTPEPYQVTWIAGARRTAGPVNPYAPIKVTEADKKEYRDQMARARPIVAMIGGGPRTPPPNVGAPSLNEIEFPATKPAFSGTNVVFVTPEGEVWVQRLRPASDPVPLYDVFDDQGRKVGEVTLRPKSRVVGFGNGTVYVTRSDEDDLQYLERYRRPSQLR
jgi:hypothetical protein